MKQNDLYNQIMKSVAKEVKKAINEAEYIQGVGNIGGTNFGDNAGKNGEFPKTVTFSVSADALRKQQIEMIKKTSEILKDYIYPKFGNNPNAKTLLSTCNNVLKALIKSLSTTAVDESWGDRFRQLLGKKDDKKQDAEYEKRLSEHNGTIHTVVSNLQIILNNNLIDTLEAKLRKAATTIIKRTIALLSETVSLKDTYSNADILKNVKNYIQQKDIQGAIDYLESIK